MDYCLACKISRGQFSEEFAVQGELFDGSGFSLFARESDLEFDVAPSEDEHVEGCIKVEALEWDKARGLALVQLPGETLENGRTITVTIDQLRQSKPRQEA